MKYHYQLSNFLFFVIKRQLNIQINEINIKLMYKLMKFLFNIYTFLINIKLLINKIFDFI